MAGAVCVSNHLNQLCNALFLGRQFTKSFRSKCPGKPGVPRLATVQTQMLGEGAARRGLKLLQPIVVGQTKLRRRVDFIRRLAHESLWRLVDECAGYKAAWRSKRIGSKSPWDATTASAQSCRILSSSGTRA